MESSHPIGGREGKRLLAYALLQPLSTSMAVFSFLSGLKSASVLRVRFMSSMTSLTEKLASIIKERCEYKDDQLIVLSRLRAGECPFSSACMYCLKFCIISALRCYLSRNSSAFILLRYRYASFLTVPMTGSCSKYPSRCSTSSSSESLLRRVTPSLL